LAINGKQIALIAAGIVLVVILFNLPKAVVKKDGVAAPAANRDKTAPSAIAPTTTLADSSHTKPFTSAQKAELVALKSKANKSSPSNSLASHLKVAEKYKAYSRYDSAAFYLEQIARNTNSTPILEAAGETYFEAFTLAIKEEKRKAMLDKCQTLLQEVLTKEPANLSAKSKLAMTYVESPNPMQGIALLREVIAKDPDNELALFNLGQLSMRSQQFDKAVGRFEKLISLHPKDSRYHYYLGQCKHALKKDSEAKDSFKKALQFNTDPTAQSTIEEALKEVENH
jgi:tetratricopeptide (TPR) repeat protein